MAAAEATETTVDVFPNQKLRDAGENGFAVAPHYLWPAYQQMQPQQVLLSGNILTDLPRVLALS